MMDVNQDGRDEMYIVTKRSDGRPGVAIDRKTYDTIRELILTAISENNNVNISGLIDYIRERIANFDPVRTSFQIYAVKNDLEARQLIHQLSVKSHRGRPKNSTFKKRMLKYKKKRNKNR